MKIKALAAYKTGSKLEPFEYERSVKDDEILVKIKYRSITTPDLRFIENFWGDSSYPLVPSAEIMGEVVELGVKVTDFQLGDVVGVGYQIDSCGVCLYCKSGRENLCQQQKVLQVNAYGGLANHIIVSHRFVSRIPKNLQIPEATQLISSGLTVYSGLKKIDIKPGLTVGVVSIGGLGHLAVKFLKKMGCEVVAFTNDSGKHEFLKKNGVTQIASSTDSEALLAYKGKLDRVVYTSFVNLDWDSYLKALKPDGKFLSLGVPDENVSFSVALLNDYAGRTIQGSYFGSPSEFKEMLDYCSTNNIIPECIKYDVSEAQKLLDQRKEKAVLFASVLEGQL
jgi:D-arabinose 1-dehydrogenase-like Zn-dependent alcohol dehydrogenase